MGLIEALSYPLDADDGVREVYRGRKTSLWYVTYSGSLPPHLRGPYSWRDVKAQIDSGLLFPTYDDLPDSFNMRGTIDMGATREARRINRKARPVWTEKALVRARTEAEAE